MIRSALAAAAAVLVLAPAARAGLIPIQVTTTPDAGYYRWTYAVNLPSETVLKAGDYFTIYDFGWLVGGTNAQPGGWTFTTQDKGVTPPQILPHDSKDIPNLTWVYTGPDETVGQTGLGNFMADSTSGTARRSDLAAHTQRQQGGEFDNNITPTAVPTATPEPATLLLAALGLPVVAAGRRLRRRQM